MYRYTVCCEFTKNDDDTIRQWLDWLFDPHIADVMKAGASGAEIVRISSNNPTYEIRYQFPSKDVFDQYIAVSAAGLRDEELRKFPPEQLGLVYSRTDGEVLHSVIR